MPDWPRFPNAPIVEALLDIRAKLPNDINLDRLAAFQDEIKESYPRRNERRVWTAQVKLGDAVEVQEQGPIATDGFIFTSKDGLRTIQARLDGFTFNKLKPYDSWEPLRDEAKSHWRRYLAIARPEIVSRIALRYINRIMIPLPIKDFKEYIQTVPEIAPALPQGLAGFLMRLVIPVEKYHSTAIVTETMEAPQNELLPWILDIDVFREGVFAVNNDEIWDILEQLRELKNEIFFQSTTAKAKELFK